MRFKCRLLAKSKKAYSDFIHTAFQCICTFLKFYIEIFSGQFTHHNFWIWEKFMVNTFLTCSKRFEIICRIIHIQCPLHIVLLKDATKGKQKILFWPLHWPKCPIHSIKTDNLRIFTFSFGTVHKEETLAMERCFYACVGMSACQVTFSVGNSEKKIHLDKGEIALHMAVVCEFAYFRGPA